MRHPQKKPQLFHEAVSDFLNALDVSIDRIAPFAGLQPEQLRRLGKDGKHHTLKPTAIDRLIMAPVLVGRPIAPELKDAWEKHLKVSSLYTVFIVATRRRSDSKWPKNPQDREFMWESATDLALYTKFTVYYMTDDSYEHRDKRGFHDDAVYLFDRWSKDQLEREQDIHSALAEFDKTVS